MCSIRQMIDVNVITRLFKVILILFLLIDLSVLAERLLWQNEAEFNAEPTMRHYKHHKNKQKHHEHHTEVYGRLKTNLRHRNHHHQNYHHTTTTTTISPTTAEPSTTTTTTQPPSTVSSSTTTTTTTTMKSIRTPEEHRLRHSNKFYQTFNLNHDYNPVKSNVRRYIDQSSYPIISTPNNNPWKNLVSSTTTYNSKHHSKRPETNARTFYNVSELMRNRLFDRDGVSYTTTVRPPKFRHPYDVLKVPLKERVRIKPVRKSFDHNDLWDDSRLMDDDQDDVLDWSTKKRHLKTKSNRKGKKLEEDDYDDDYYEDEEEGDVNEKNVNDDSISKDPDDIYSKSYIPGTLTKHKFETLGTRDAVKDTRQNYLTNQKKEKALANDHANKMYNEALCKWPKPRIVAVQGDPDKLYTPHCTILHRCGDDSGCCLTDSRTCTVKHHENVDLYFYVKSMHQRTGTIEKRTFVNHTECYCESKAHTKPLSRPETMRRATVISCKCTKAFEKVLEEDGTCRCDCSSSNNACDWKKRGREHFSIEDRKCILEGRCNRPTCEYGHYDKIHGRCPRKEDKLATGFSYHSKI